MTSRKLIDGLKSDSTNEQVEKDFVFRENNEAQKTSAGVTSSTNSTMTDTMPLISGRVPVTTRCRPELATKLKQASLRRQLNGESPYYVQDIMEEAIQRWLIDHGYL